MGEPVTDRETIIRLEQRLRIAEERAAALERDAELHAMRAREVGQRLSAILSISGALLISRSIDTIVQLVMREAALLFPGTTAAEIFVHDHEQVGAPLRSATDEGAVSQTLLRLADHAQSAPRAMLLVGPELEHVLGDGGSDRLPLSALLAPLRVEHQRYGALVLCGGTHGHLYHPRDIPFAQALADLAAVAIDEITQRRRSAALQADLVLTQTLRAEAEQRLNTAQAQLLQSAKLAAVGELAASVAHEINNPLYAARNSLYLLEQDLAADTPQRTFLDIAQQELGRIARIITRMRDFYRPSRGELSATNINATLRDTLELVNTHLRHNHIQAQMQFDHDLPLLTAHADQLRQVFLNIILNACDAMGSGGTLTVSTRGPALSNGDQAIEVAISDTGAGIRPEHLQHLFEPFYTTKAQGTGLGLAISAHIVTQHGGRLQVESEVGCGATFVIRLPLQQV
jgi:two-component system, NtrC family, sensor kinase